MALRVFMAAALCVATLGAQASAHGLLASIDCLGQDFFAYDVYFPADEPNTVIVTANLGLFVSRDAGESFGWVCAEAMGLPTNNANLIPGAPLLTVAADAQAWISSGPSTSHTADFCSYTTPDSDLLSFATVVGSGFVQSAGDEYMFLSTVWPGTGPYGIWRSSDGGENFSITALSSYVVTDTFGNVLGDPAGAVLYTIAADPEQARIYSTTDLGLTWTPGRAFRNVVSAQTLGFALPSHVYLATLTNPTASCVWETHLWTSDNAGVAATEISSRNDDVLVGASTASAQDIVLAWQNTGVVRQHINGATTPITGVPVGPLTCMIPRSDGTHAVCVQNPSVLVGTLSDLGEWTPLFTRHKVYGPLSCPTLSDVTSSCEERWAAIATQYGFPTTPIDEPTTPATKNRKHDAGGCNQSPGETATAGMILTMVALVARRRLA